MPREAKGREIWGLYYRESRETGISAHPCFIQLEEYPSLLPVVWRGEVFFHVKNYWLNAVDTKSKPLVRQIFTLKEDFRLERSWTKFFFLETFHFLFWLKTGETVWQINLLNNGFFFTKCQIPRRSHSVLGRQCFKSYLQLSLLSLVRFSNWLEDWCVMYFES